MKTAQGLHRQLESVRDLRSIVRTMKALAAASIRQYETAVESLTDYYRAVELGLQVALRDGVAPTRRGDERGRHGAIVFGSDHGLCGRFNEEIADFAGRRIASAGGSSIVLAVGVRAAGLLDQSGHPVEEVFFVPGSVERITETVRPLLLKIDQWRREAGVHHVHLFHNRGGKGRGYEPVHQRLLPVDLHQFAYLGRSAWPTRVIPMFTMDRQALLRALLRQYFFVSLFRACAESQASEHATRLAAMQRAEKNLDERTDELTARFRRVRQDAITGELLDVVTGFEALSKK